MVNYYLIIKLLIYLPIILGIRLRHLSFSDSTRIELFKAFVAGEQNTVKTIIFTVLVGFDQKEDIAFYTKFLRSFKRWTTGLFC